jgi:hypothetical protein
VTPGWFFGYFIDLSDMQWREWRKNGLLLIVAFSAYVGISRLIRANARPLLRIFYLISGVGGMFVMHGAGAIWVILSIGIAFIAARVLRTPPLVAWVLHISILLLVHFDHVPLFNHFIPFGIGLWLVCRAHHSFLVLCREVLTQLVLFPFAIFRMAGMGCCLGKCITKCCYFDISAFTQTITTT